MEQELISNKSIAIIGAGPAGVSCAKFLLDFGVHNITIFDSGKYLRTILPTGGGRCNLAHNIYDTRDLAENYPRGEKFLYSIFSKFSTGNTLDYFSSIGVETYIQEDSRIFPTSNSSKEVREKMLKAISKANFENEKILKINQINNGYKLTTNKSKYHFDIIVIATGGHCNTDFIKELGIKFQPPTQALVGLTTKQIFVPISGVSLKNIKVKYKKTELYGDLLFTHKGVSGPIIYKLSSVLAREPLPYKIEISFIDDVNLQEILNKNAQKEIRNILTKYIPKSLGEYLLDNLKIDKTKKCHLINGKERDAIKNLLSRFEIDVVGKNPDSEVVTCGGIDLSEINPKTMGLKKYKNIYCCGEILDIDGFCGGFNLQNCWSTAFVVAHSITNQ